MNTIPTLCLDSKSEKCKVGILVARDRASKQEAEMNSELNLVFRNEELLRRTTLSEIRERVSDDLAFL